MKAIWAILIGVGILVAGEGNASKEGNATLSKDDKAILEAQIKKQMEREKKYAKEQRFYEGKEYDLNSEQVDPAIVDKVPVIEPEDDFDMSDVYSD
jgi:hypothetical protein